MILTFQQLPFYKSQGPKFWTKVLNPVHWGTSHKQFIWRHEFDYADVSGASPPFQKT
jgi:hypothetical protein